MGDFKRSEIAVVGTRGTLRCLVGTREGNAAAQHGVIELGAAAVVVFIGVGLGLIREEKPVAGDMQHGHCW